MDLNIVNIGLPNELLTVFLSSDPIGTLTIVDGRLMGNL